MKFATVTAKGQTTIPKEIRERLKLKSGDRVHWAVENGRAILTPRNRNIGDLYGILHVPGRPPLTDDDIDAAVAAELAERDDRSRQ